MIRWFAAEQGAGGQTRSTRADRLAGMRLRGRGRRHCGATCQRWHEPTDRLARALSILALGLLAPAGFLSMAANAAEAEAERVAIRAAPHAGYARLVFGWPGPIAFERTEAEGSVTLRFARPFAGDLSAVPERLGDYLLDIERLDDRRGVRLHLAVDVHARLSQFDPDLVVVDLERQDAATSGDDAGVVVRTGEHEGFVRIVFEWPGPVQFRQRRHGRDLTLEFDRKAQVDAAALTRRLRPWLQELTAGSAAQGSRMRVRRPRPPARPSRYRWKSIRRRATMASS